MALFKITVFTRYVSRLYLIASSPHSSISFSSLKRALGSPSAKSFPFLRITAREQASSAKVRSCVAISLLWLRRDSTLIRFLRDFGSRKAVGSSKSSAVGSMESTVAIAAAHFSPPESLSGERSLRCSIEKRL